MYCSITWAKASTMPLRTCFCGRLKVVSGSSTENTGKTAPEVKASFSCVARREMTALPLDSEPVAGRVSTEPRGSAVLMPWPPPRRISQGSVPSKRAAAAMNFAASRTEPPPTARMKPTWPAFTCSTAWRQVSSIGLASMPPNSRTRWCLSAAFVEYRTVGLNQSAAVEQQHGGGIRHPPGQCGDLAAAKQNLSRVLENEVLHNCRVPKIQWDAARVHAWCVRRCLDRTRRPALGFPLPPALLRSLARPQAISVRDGGVWVWLKATKAALINKGIK